MEYLKNGVIYQRDVEHCEISPYIKLVTIKDVVPAINSDFLESITFEEIGWQTISQKGLHRPGEKVLFIPAESVLPFELGEKLEVTKYLSGGRVRVAKLRGNRSEGIIVEPEIVEPYIPHIMKWEDKPSVFMGGECIKAYRVHPYFHKFYHIPNILNEPYTFRPDEKLYYSEKIHGCLANRSIITMADGSKKPITNVKAGEYVIGYEDNRICQSKVLKIFNNGKGDIWLKVFGKRKYAGKGANIFSVYCTPNHRFWNPTTSDYIPAENLRKGDEVTLLRTSLGLTPNKLPERFRGMNPFVPTQESIYRQRLINLKIDCIVEDKKIQSKKYDLETETHNFFVNDILVHNSNMRCGEFKDLETEEYIEYIGSHNMILKESDKNIYWRIFRKKLAGKIPIDIEFFAEVYGPGVQDLSYGLKEVDVKIFAATSKGYYMNPNTLDIMCKRHGLPVVNFGFTKFKSVDQLRRLANDPSEYTDKHMREGIVIVSADYSERMAKCKSDAYEERRNKKERH